MRNLKRRPDGSTFSRAWQDPSSGLWVTHTDQIKYSQRLLGQLRQLHHKVNRHGTQLYRWEVELNFEPTPQPAAPPIFRSRADAARWCYEQWIAVGHPDPEDS